MIGSITVEICAGSTTDVIRTASVREVDRIELNCALELGGLTPSQATFAESRKIFPGKIICMVRPRPAGFVYNQFEKETMLKDAEFFLENGADGIVFGVLNGDLTVDISYTEKMVQLIHSYGKEAVFHKAFDETPDLFAAAETLASCGIDRILTSGGAENTELGIPVIHDLQSRFKDRIEILPGGGVSENNASLILQKTGCHAIHMTAKSSYEDCGTYYAVDPVRIRKILAVLKPAGQRVFSGEDTAMLKNDAYEKTVLFYEDDGNERY